MWNRKENFNNKIYEINADETNVELRRSRKIKEMYYFHFYINLNVMENENFRQILKYSKVAVRISARMKHLLKVNFGP